MLHQVVTVIDGLAAGYKNNHIWSYFSSYNMIMKNRLFNRISHYFKDTLDELCKTRQLTALLSRVIWKNAVTGAYFEALQ